MAIACLVMAGAAQAQGPGARGDGDGRGRGPGGRPSTLLRAPRGGGMMLPVRELALTDSQREQVEQIRAANRAAVQETQKRVRDAERAQRAAIQTVPLNEALVRSTTQALATAQTDLAVQEARVFNDVWQLLTPEQQTKLKTLRHASRHHERTPVQPERSQQSDLQGQESATPAS